MARADKYMMPYGNPFDPITKKPIFGDPATVIGGVGAAGSILGGISGSDASSNAADAQVQAANQATTTQQQMFDTINNQQAPYRQAGGTALSALLYGTGLGPQAGQASQPKALDYATWAAQHPGTQSNNGNANSTIRGYGDFRDFTTKGRIPLNNSIQNGPTQDGYNSYLNGFNQSNPAQNGTGGASVPGVGYGDLTHQFNAADLKTNLSPSYQFMLNQGLGALQNSQASQGGLVSGNALKGINDYAQNYASNGYQQAYNNYTGNQNNIFNRLSNIAGMGQNANNTTAQTSAAFAPGIAGTIQGAGQAQASGIVGSSNNLRSGLNNALSYGQFGANSLSGFGGAPSGGAPSGGNTSGMVPQNNFLGTSSPLGGVNYTGV